MGAVELHAFGSLQKVFAARGWSLPVTVEIIPGETPRSLMERLGIPAGEVEAVFVNGRVEGKDYPLQDGDRVALVPEGIPSVHRVMLGFYSRR